MFVCHGNICRSPMAEIIMKDMVKKKGLENDFYISSSATSTEEIFNGVGNPVYPLAEKELNKHSLTGRGKRAVRLKQEDYGQYDLFIGMDNANIRNMNKILEGDPERKIHKLLEYAGTTREVDDPWYSGYFEKAYDDIYRGCEALLNYLIKERPFN